jgi:hypothetical protein
MAAALTFKSKLQEFYPQIDWMVGMTDGCLAVSATNRATGSTASSLIAETICRSAEAAGTLDQLVRDSAAVLIARCK